MVQSCIVVGCTNRWNKDSKVSWHRFPPERDSERRRLWMSALNRKGWVAKSTDRVCGQHFLSGCASHDPLNPDYVPSVAMGYDSRQFKTPEVKKSRHFRSEERQRRVLNREKDKHQRSSAARALIDLSASFSSMGDLADTEDSPPKNDLHAQCREEISEYQETVTMLQMEKKMIMEEYSLMQAENRELRQKVLSVKFSIHNLRTGNSDQKTLFYTGLSNFATLIWLVDFLRDSKPTFKSVSVEDSVIVTLMKLRLNLLNFDIASRFGIGAATVSDIVNKCLPVMAVKLKFLVRWPEKENIIRTLPRPFKTAFPNARCIIDCTEIFVERPGNLTARAATWSNYKHSNTLKYLVAITPCGAGSFISKAFGGRTSDKVVTQRSGFLDLLEFSDLVLADRGFLIQEEITSRNCYLSMPSFTKGQTQLSQKQVECSRQLARVRIHVERAIERLKIFKILNTTMQLSLVPHADNILTVCSAICNLQPKLVK